MNTKTMECPIIGLVYEKHEKDGRSFYSLSPSAGYRMRVRSMDTEDEEGNVAPCYLRRLAFPHPYDFDVNENHIESEAL